MAAKTPLLDMTTLKRLNDLCELGARPPVIETLVPSVPKSMVVRIWEGMHGKRPPSGPLPYNVEHYIAGPARRLQSSFVLNMFDQLRLAGIHDADALIAAFKQYQATFGTAEDGAFSFDRTWLLIREYVTSRSFKLVSCPNCGVRYIHRNLELINHRNCPGRRCIKSYDDLSVASVIRHWEDSGKIELAKQPEPISKSLTQAGFFDGSAAVEGGKAELDRTFLQHFSA